ncbi:MAG: NAD(P)-dependent oxidoreductase [Pseudonocardiaceae bacterium]
MDNATARSALEQTFARVAVARSRENAITELVALGDTVDAAVVGVREHIDVGVLATLTRLRVLGSVGAGTDHLDLEALADRGVQVITTPGVNAVSVAEHALMMILALAKRAFPAHAAVLTGEDRAGMPDRPIEVRGQRVGVLGAGATAGALIPLVQALGAEVMVWTRRPDRHPELTTTSLDEIFHECGIVSIHLPLTAETYGLVDARLLRLLPPDALVVNVARKEIVDPDGLRMVVAERPDLRFAVDDFGLAADGTVVLVGNQGLWSPHTAGVTVQALAAMQDAAVLGVVRAVTGQR